MGFRAKVCVAFDPWISTIAQKKSTITGERQLLHKNRQLLPFSLGGVGTSTVRPRICQLSTVSYQKLSFLWQDKALPNFIL